MQLSDTDAPSIGSRSVAVQAPLFIVMNVGSGKHDSDQVRSTLETQLGQRQRPVHIRPVTDPSRLDEVARECVAEARTCGGVVVAAGGDGTIRSVAQATLGSGCAFGVLPLGTFNLFSRAQGIPSDLERACEVLLGTRAYEVQVGMINEQVFLVNASLGLYPKLLEDREQAKSRLGRSRMVAFGAALGTLLRPHRMLRLDIDGPGGKRSLVTPTLFVGNNRLQLERVGLEESALLEQHRLVAVAVKAASLWALLRVAFSALLGRLNTSDDVLSFDFARILVRPRRLGRRIKVAMDGEVSWLSTPLTFRAGPEPLFLLRPEGEIGEDPG